MDTSDHNDSVHERRTFPMRSDFQTERTEPEIRHQKAGDNHAKVARLSMSMGDIHHHQRRMHSEQANYRESDERFLHHGERMTMLEPDCKPREHGSEHSAHNENPMETENLPSREARRSVEAMEAEGGDAAHVHSSIPKKEFPTSSRPYTLPVVDSNVNAPPSSEDDDNFSQLSPLDLQHMHIQDGQPARSLPIFTNRLPRAAQPVYPTHQNIRKTQATNPVKGVSKSGVLQSDMRDAKNRLQTFEEYWPDADSDFSNVKVLTSCGFYATGYGDAVRCFACEATIANWDRDDDPTRRHLEISPDCRFMNGHSCGNRPLSPVRKSKRSPGESTRRDRKYARGRSRYRRESHETQRTHAYSSQRSRATVEPYGRHGHSASPPRIPSSRSSVARSNSSPPASPMATEPTVPEYMNPTAEMIERTRLLGLFPCVDPMYPAMRETTARLRTFNDPTFRATTRLQASDAALVEAGLFYEGQSDDTKCWYCGGGLRQYRPEDDPWVEHAKYYPECEYLLQQRGPGFVSDISARFPNVNRPVLPRMQNLATPMPPPPQQNRPQGPTPTPQPTTPTLPPIHQGQFQPTPLVILSQSRPQRTPTTPTFPHLPEQPQSVQPPPPQPRPPIPPPSPRAMQQNIPPPPPPPAQTVPRNLRTVSGTAIEDPQAMLQARERMVDNSMNSEAVREARNMGFTEDQIRTAQMKRIIGLGGPYQTANNLIEALLNPNADPAALEPPPAPQQPRRSNISINNGQIRISGGNFERAIFGGRRGRSQIIIDGVPLHEYIAQQRNEGFEQQPEPVVFNNVGTTLGSTQPYNTAPTPSTAPMVAETSTTNSNDVPSTSTTDPPEPTGTAEERLEALQKEYQCKICYSNRVEVLFEPCGHICACLSCASKVGNCPMCRKRITRYIKTYHC